MGRLTVTILGCRDLEAKDWFGRSDPYVKVSCSGKTYRTKTVDKSLNPNFNEQFTFFIADPDTEQLRLDVYDSDLFKDDKLGTYVLSLSGLTKGKKIEGWYVLQAPAKKGLIGVCLYPEDFGSSETPTNALKAKVPGKRPSPAHVSDSDEEESRSFQEKPPVQKSEVPPPKNPVSTEIPPQPIVAPSVKPQPVVAPAPQEKVATPSPAQVSVQWPTPQVETTQGGNQGNAATSWSATQPHQDICTYNATAGYMCAVQQAPQQNTPVGQQYPLTIPSSNGYNVGGGMQMPSTTPNPYGYYPTPGNTTYPGNTNPWPNVTFPQPPTAVYTSVPTASMNQPGNAYPNMAPYPPQQAALPLSYQNPFGHTY